MTTPRISIEDLRVLFEYRPDTGEFRRKQSTNGRRIDTSWFKARPGRRLELFICGKNYQATWIAWALMTGAWPTLVIDHMDTDESNNVWTNLRDIPQGWNAQNLQSPPSHNTSGFLGAVWHKRTKRWMAQIKVNRVNQHLGYFDTPELAHAAYVERKRAVHPGSLL